MGEGLKILVASGWYSEKEGRNYKTFGTNKIRDNGLRKIWLHCVEKYIKPSNIFYTNSASPQPMQAIMLEEIEQHELNLIINPGHPQTTTYHYCGWTASVILGLEYALLCDYDILIYVEQDCLLYGDDISKIIKHSLKKYGLSLGNGDGTPQFIQQSLFAIHKTRFRNFLCALHNIDFSDREVSPEDKFHLAACKQPSRYFLSKVVWLEQQLKIKRYSFVRKVITALKYFLFRSTRKYDFLPFGYGRSRPINFNDDTFYFQHASEEELKKFADLIGSANV